MATKHRLTVASMWSFEDVAVRLTYNNCLIDVLVTVEQIHEIQKTFRLLPSVDIMHSAC